MRALVLCAVLVSLITTSVSLAQEIPVRQPVEKECVVLMVSSIKSGVFQLPDVGEAEHRMIAWAKRPNSTHCVYLIVPKQGHPFYLHLKVTPVGWFYFKLGVTDFKHFPPNPP